MLRTRRWAWPTIFALAAWSSVLAQFEVTATIEPAREIHVDQTIELVLQVAGSSNPEVKTPRLPGLTNLRAVGDPSRRISSNWVNGRFSAKVELRYDLLTEAAGPAEIPSIELQVDDKTYRTDPIRFTVVAAPPPTPSAGEGRSSGRSSRREDTQVFLRAEIGSDEVWVGQAVPLSVSLFAEGRIGSPSWRGQPQLSSFWVEELEVDPEAEAHSTTIGGTRYIVYPLQRKVLVPQGPGQFEIEPYVLQLQVRGRSSDPFDIFSLSRGDTIVRRSEPLSMTVRPLPSAGRPESFGGAVGTFALTASLDREETAVNDAVALKASVEGEGFLLAVAPPAFEAPAGVKLFDPEVRSSSRGSGGTLVSSKSWEWILVPGAPGEIRLPPLEFHYFDSERGRYRTARHSFAPLIVRHSDEALEVPLAGGEIRVLQRDLAFIKPLNAPLRVREPRTTERKLFVTMLLLPLAWVPLWIALGRRRAHLRQDQGLARGRKAHGQARRAFRAARRRVDGTDGAVFHEELAHALVEYVADRFNRAPSGLSYEVVDELLASRGLEESLRRRFRTCLESCDFARFVPASAQGERREELLREAEALVDEMEKAL